MRIAMVASEARPFCKTGGLADVSYALSKELVSMGNDVEVIIPYYKIVKDKFGGVVKKIDTFDLWMSWRHQGANVLLELR